VTTTVLHRLPVSDVTRKFDPVFALKKYHAAIEARDLTSIAEMLVEDAVYQSKGLGPVKGRSAIVAAMESYFDNHPDHRALDTSVSADGPLAATSSWQLCATNKASGISISRQGRERISFNADGMISAVDVEDFERWPNN
jgi:ketosteroid isomerase-like protein